MIEIEFLFTVAQIAATFAGFSTLVVVVQQESSGTQGTLVTIRLIWMLRQSLVAILFCLVPFLPPYAGLSVSHSWQISSGLYFIAWLVNYMQVLYEIRSRDLASQLSRYNQINAYVIHPIAIIGLGLGGLGFWGSNAGLIYLCCVLLMLYLCGFLFLQQVGAISADPTVT